MKISVYVSINQIGYLLSSAFEGGVGYWCTLDQKGSVRPPEVDFKSFKPDSIFADSSNECFYVHWPLSKGGRVRCLYSNTNDDTLRNEESWLDLKSIEKGLTIMARDYPRHWGDFLSQSFDANTGDVFLQCCLFGELVYG